jgi:hypothetical protein
VQFQGGREYAMRIWLDTDKVATHNLSAAEVLAVLRAQNLQVSAGVLNRPPVPGDRAYQINVEARGRLTAPEEFGNIVLKSDSQGRVTRVRDVGHAEIGAVDYGNTAFVDRDDASSLLIYAEPGAARTENVIREASDIILTTKGIEHIAPFAGQIQNRVSALCYVLKTCRVNGSNGFRHKYPPLFLTIKYVRLACFLGVVICSKSFQWKISESPESTKELTPVLVKSAITR